MRYMGMNRNLPSGELTKQMGNFQYSSYVKLSRNSLFGGYEYPKTKLFWFCTSPNDTFHVVKPIP